MRSAVCPSFRPPDSSGDILRVIFYMSEGFPRNNRVMGWEQGSRRSEQCLGLLGISFLCAVSFGSQPRAAKRSRADSPCLMAGHWVCGDVYGELKFALSSGSTDELVSKCLRTFSSD